MKTKFRIWIMCFVAVFVFAAAGVNAKAAPTDEIKNYIIVVGVNEDATLDIYYHIDWLVLESKKAGPVTWVQIGIPNRHVQTYQPMSDTIKNMSITTKGGAWARIDFDREYHEGEIVSFDFMIRQDYMYQVNKTMDGFAAYEFTPGWFDEIAVDNLEIHWKADKAMFWVPEVNEEGEYLIWRTKLKPKERFTITVNYADSAYGFDTGKTIVEEKRSSGPQAGAVAGSVIVAIVVIILRVLPVLQYSANTGFGEAKAPEIIRTKIEYWPSCPGCGAARPEGKEICEYCGGNFVKSKELLKAESLKEEDKEAMIHTKNGTFQYHSNPNTYVRVHVIRPARTYSGGRSHSCVHSSCACACACACAGGGRAGCSVKDFYNTNLKLKQLDFRTKNKQKLIRKM